MQRNSIKIILMASVLIMPIRPKPLRMLRRGGK